MISIAFRRTGVCGITNALGGRFVRAARFFWSAGGTSALPILMRLYADIGIACLPEAKWRALPPYLAGAARTFPFGPFVWRGRPKLRYAARRDSGDVVSSGVGFLVIDDQGRIRCNYLFAES